MAIAFAVQIQRNATIPILSPSLSARILLSIKKAKFAPMIKFASAVNASVKKGQNVVQRRISPKNASTDNGSHKRLAPRDCFAKAANAHVPTAFAVAPMNKPREFAPLAHG